MDPFESISTENMDKMLKNYANYKNICDEFKKERETEELKYSQRLPSVSAMRRNGNLRLSGARNFSSTLFEKSATGIGDSTDDEKLEKEESEENISEDTDSNEGDGQDVQLRTSSKYKEKFKRRTAEMQQELEQLRQDQQTECETHAFAMQSIEDELRKEKSENSERYKGVASHYDHMLLRTKQLSCRLQEDHCNMECKMNSLREQVGSLQGELHGWLNNQFDEMMGKFDAFGKTPEAFNLNFADAEVKDEDKIMRCQNQKEKGVEELKHNLLQKPEKSTKLKVVQFKNEPCPRLNRRRFSKNI